MSYQWHNATEVRPLGWGGFHHIALVTPSLDETIHFYQRILNMQVGDIYPATSKRGRHCFITPDCTKTWGIHFFEYLDAQLFIEPEELKQLFTEPNSAKMSTFIPGALQHIAFALPNEMAGLTLRDHLKKHGVMMTQILEQPPVRNFIFPDNNGLLLEAAWTTENS